MTERLDRPKQSPNQVVLNIRLLLWQAPLGMHSAKGRPRHQSPEWAILSHVDCFIHGEEPSVGDNKTIISTKLTTGSFS